MRIVFIVPLLLMLLACQLEEVKTDLNSFREAHYPRWIASYSVTIPDDLSSNGQSFIEGTPSSWRILAEVNYYAEKSFAPRKDCLLYRFPGPIQEQDKRKQDGELKVFIDVGEKNCQDLYFEKAQSRLTGLSWIKMALVRHKKNQLTLELGLREKTGVHSVQSLHFPLLNYTSGHKHELFHNDLPLKDHPGVIFFSLQEPETSWPIRFTPTALGGKEDSFPEGTSHLCHDVDSECRSLTPNRCGECKYGWYEVVGGNCSQGGPKFCGEDRCGEKNWPACPRGRRHEREEMQTLDVCSVASRVAFCKEGLRPLCDENKILVCL